MKIFVTGGTGYVGKNFINYALKNKHFIYALTRKKNNQKRKNLFWLKGRLDKKFKELSNCDILIHLASEGVYDKYYLLKNVTKLILFCLLNYLKTQ